MSKVDKDTRAELRRLQAIPGHERMGIMAKSCIADLLDELEEFEKHSGAAKPINAAAPEVTKSFEDRPKTETGRWSFKKPKADPVVDGGEE